MEKKVAMRDEEGGMTNQPNKVGNLQRTKNLMRKNTEKPQRTRYGSPGPWENP